MSKFTRIWDEENKKYVFMPAEEYPEPNWCCVYGNYVVCDADKIKAAKAEMLENMIDKIRELAKKDEFWIVKDANGEHTVGWKAEFPQMLPKENHTCDAPAVKKPSIVVPVFDFGRAIQELKQGKSVARMGWNGKNQYVELATCISYKGNAGEIVNVHHNNIGNKALAFVGTSGVQMGWLASQADMLADDWYIVE